MKSISTLFTLLLGTGWIAAFAQPADSSKTEFSLKDAWEYALENNADAKNAAIDIQIGKHRIMENIALGLPQVTGAVDYNYNIAPPVFIFPNIAGPNPNPNEFITIDAAPLNTMTASAQISTLLVSGQYFIGIQTAKTFLELTKQQKEKTDIDVKEQIIKAYYLVLIAEESKRVIDSSLRVIERTVYETEQIYESGLIEELDVEQLQLVLFTTQDAAAQINRSYDVAMYSLKFQMGYPFDKPIHLTDGLESLIESSQYEQVIGSLGDKMDVKSNIDYRLITQKMAIDNYQVKLQRASAYPTLSTFLSVSGNFFNNERWLFLGNGTTSTLGGVIWGVSLRVPIFSSWNRVSKLKQLKLEVVKDRNLQYSTEQGLNVSYQNNKNQLIDYYQRYLTTKKNYELANKIRNVNRIKFTEGLISSIDLTQAETQFFDAQQRYFQAIFDLLNAKIQVDKLLNQF